MRGRRISALAFHRLQLAELEQDRDAALLPSREYDQALLEVQRRLLAADTGDTAEKPGGKTLLFATLVIVPLAACGLYLVHGSPELAPPQIQKIDDNGADLIDALQNRLAHLDPTSLQARKGWMLLARIEAEQHHMAEAAAAWRMALKSGFDPFIAIGAAEADAEAKGHLTEEDAFLMRQALRAAPNAPFRPMVERRLHASGQAP